jgi:hypothetical protein
MEYGMMKVVPKYKALYQGNVENQSELSLIIPE